MSIHLSDSVVAGLPQEPKLLSDVRVRLIEQSEQVRFDELLCREHYLKNATVVGQTLRGLPKLKAKVLEAFKGTFITTALSPQF
jgi:hypothetical protein